MNNSHQREGVRHLWWKTIKGGGDVAARGGGQESSLRTLHPLRTGVEPLE